MAERNFETTKIFMVCSQQFMNQNINTPEQKPKQKLRNTHIHTQTENRMMNKTIEKKAPQSQSKTNQIYNLRIEF